MAGKALPTILYHKILSTCTKDFIVEFAWVLVRDVFNTRVAYLIMTCCKVEKPKAV